MEGTILGAFTITVNNQIKFLPPWGLHLSWGNSKERNEKNTNSVSGAVEQENQESYGWS